MDPEQLTMLRDVVAQRQPRLSPLVEQLALGRPLTLEEASLLRNEVLVAITEHCLQGGELTPEGESLDDVIRALRACIQARV